MMKVSDSRIIQVAYIKDGQLTGLPININWDYFLDNYQYRLVFKPDAHRPTARLVRIMLQISIIILFRISLKSYISKFFYYSQVPLLMLKLFPNFDSFFPFINQNILQ